MSRISIAYVGPLLLEQSRSIQRAMDVPFSYGRVSSDGVDFEFEGNAVHAWISECRAILVTEDPIRASSSHGVMKDEYRKLSSSQAIVYLWNSDSDKLGFDVGVHLRMLARDLAISGGNLNHYPVVFQVDRRETEPPGILLEKVKEEVSWPICGHVESVLSIGVGVKETLRLAIGMAKIYATQRPL